ncbi:MAG: hypothetical protein DWQ02_10520 [Bacteroidetes bacterium]|nr:MAG: hypothetical protein DWQ02_10520 [Bacteroidota bacterium]
MRKQILINPRDLKTGLLIFFIILIIIKLISTPIGIEFYLGLLATILLILYLLFNTLFNKYKTVVYGRLISFSYYDFIKAIFATPYFKTPFPPPPKMGIEVKFPKKIKVNNTEEIVLSVNFYDTFFGIPFRRKGKIDNFISKPFIFNFSDKDPQIRIISPSIKIKPDEVVKLNLLDSKFPAFYKWLIESDSVGMKKIIYSMNNDLLDLFPEFEEMSNEIIKEIKVVNEIGLSFKVASWLKTSWVIIAILLGIPFFQGAYKKIDDRLFNSSAKLEKKIDEESKILAQIEQTVLKEFDLEEINYHLKKVESSSNLLKEGEIENNDNLNSKLEFLEIKLQSYQRLIFPKLRKSYSIILSKNNKKIKYFTVGNSRTLHLSSNIFKDSLLLERAMSEIDPYFTKLRYDSLCFFTDTIEVSNDCIEIIDLNSERDSKIIN